MRGLGRLTSGGGATRDAVGSKRDPGACRTRDCRAAPGVFSCGASRIRTTFPPCSGGKSATGAHKLAAVLFDARQQIEASIADDAKTRSRNGHEMTGSSLMMSDMNHIRRRNPMPVDRRLDRTTDDAQTRQCPVTSATRAQPCQITHARATSCRMCTCVHGWR